jgi:hypothetical protein
LVLVPHRQFVSEAVLEFKVMRGRSKLTEVNRAPVLTLWAAVSRSAPFSANTSTP